MVTFTSEPVSPHLTRILTPFGVCMYLVQGRERAALLDTGFGLGDLKGYVETLVGAKPYLVLLSHGHLDHAGGSAQFDQVYLNKRDWALEKWHNTLERRRWDVYHGPGGVPDGVAEEDFLPQRTAPYCNIDEGDSFDLGGVRVQPIAVPGHTQGSLVFLIPEDRIAIFGDACGEQTLLHFRESAPIARYQKALCHLQESGGLFDTVLRYHGSFRSNRQILQDSIELCGQVLARTDAAIPVRMMDLPGCLARPKQHPGKEGNMVYNPGNLAEG